MADKDLLDDAKEEFKLCVDAESQQRKDSLDDLEFAKLGKQWEEAVKQARADEKRPCLTINRLPAFIKQVTNDARQNRPSITTHPVGDGADTETSKILNGLIRNIEAVSKADIAYDTALDFAVTMGFGYWIVRDQYTCDDSFDKDLSIERVANPFSIYGDPRSTSADSSDWNTAFVTDMLSKKEFKRRYPGSDASGFTTEGASEETQLWFSDESIQVAEYWKREEVTAKLLKLSDGSIMHEAEYLKIKDLCDLQGITIEGDRDTKSYKVTQKIISGCDILETNEWLGKYIPIVPVYGDEINVNGKRFFQGLVRFAKDPQRMFNYWRTTTTELVALAPKAPFIGAVGAFSTDSARWGTANTQTHPYLEYDVVEGAAPPQRQPFAGVPAGALQEALNASDDMKSIMGIYDASLGAKSNETSGRAIMARQREGDVSTFNYIDNLSRAIEHTGRILVDLIPKHYDVARIVRCVKEDGSTYPVPVNQPVIAKQNPEAVPGQQNEEFEPAQEYIEGLTKVFDLTTGKYDVTVAAGPSFTSRREESANQMMEFIRVFPQAAPLIGDLLAKNLDWPGADEVAARLKAMLPPQAAGKVSPIVQQLQQQLQQQDMQAKQAVGQLNQALQETKQQLEDKAQESALERRKVDIDAFKAETERIKVEGEIALQQRQQLESEATRAMSAIINPPSAGFSLPEQQL